MANSETILDALDEYDRKPSDVIPPVLEQYLQRIATTGETTYPWIKLKPVFIAKMDQSMKKFHEQVPTDHLPLCPNVENIKFEEMRTRLIEAVGQFNGAPFTIQRLCELIVNPEKHYKRTDKFLRGIEKNILVVSTVDPEGRKIVSESKFLSNGLDSNGVIETKTPEKLKAFAMPPPPNNSPATTNWSFSSVTAATPMESEWRPQPMDSSSEAVSASPSELWEKSPDTCVKHEVPSLSYQSAVVTESLAVPKPSEDSPSKQVSSSDDLPSSAEPDTQSEATAAEQSDSSGTEKAEPSSAKPAEQGSGDAQPAAADETTSCTSEDGEPDRKRAKTDDSDEATEAAQLEQQPEQPIEERRQSEGFETTPVTSSVEPEKAEEPHSTPSPETSAPSKDDSAIDSSTNYSKAGPSSVEPTGSDSNGCDTQNSESAPAEDSRDSQQADSISTNPENVVSSMDAAKQAANDDVDSTPDSDVSSGSGSTEPAAAEDRDANSAQNVTSSDGGATPADQSGATSDTDVPMPGESDKEDAVSDSTSRSDSSCDNAQAVSASADSESHVSQSGDQEPMDTA